jgi:hypothetical protein
MRPLALAVAVGALLAGPAAAQDQAPAAAPPATAPPPAAAPAPPQAPPNLETLPPSDAAGILGKSVWGANGEDMGLVVDVIVDRAGVPQAAVIDFGGFLGVGSRKIAVDWTLLEFRPGDDKKPVSLNLDPAALKAAPEFKPGAQPIAIVGAPPPPPDHAGGDK